MDKDQLFRLEGSAKGQRPKSQQQTRPTTNEGRNAKATKAKGQQQMKAAPGKATEAGLATIGEVHSK